MEFPTDFWKDIDWEVGKDKDNEEEHKIGEK